MNIEIEREEDGRWIAEVSDLPGVMSYGKTREEAISKVETLSLRNRTGVRLPYRSQELFLNFFL